MKRVGIVCFDGAVALDIAGPAEVFSTASNFLAEDAKYVIQYVGASDSIRSESGLVIKPDFSIGDTATLDTVLVPGGAGIREPSASWISPWLAKEQCRRLASVCTGIYALGKAGLLHGKRATCHWRYANDVREQYPGVFLEEDLIFVRSGNVYTSAGATAGIDLALHLVEEDHGAEVALAVARELVVYMKRSGNQAQFSAPLQFQAQAKDDFSSFVSYVQANLHREISVQDMAGSMALSVRHFARKCRERFGCSPGKFLEKERIRLACERLLSTEENVEVIASSLGFGSAEGFRRAFERNMSLSPRTYRNRFQTTG